MKISVMKKEAYCVRVSVVLPHIELRANSVQLACGLDLSYSKEVEIAQRPSFMMTSFDVDIYRCKAYSGEKEQTLNR